MRYVFKVIFSKNKNSKLDINTKKNSTPQKDRIASYLINNSIFYGMIIIKKHY